MFIDQMVSKMMQESFPGEIILVEADANNLLQVYLTILKEVLKKYRLIIVSSSRPYVSLKNLYKAKNIDMSRIYIIDTVSKAYNPTLIDEKQVKYVSSVSDLTHISIYINSYLSEIAEDKMILVDSITTMLIHNDQQTYVRFIHGLLTKLRMQGVSAILLSVSGETSKEVKAEIAQLCDRTVSI